MPCNMYKLTCSIIHVYMLITVITGYAKTKLRNGWSSILNSPISHTINVPQGMNNNAQDISDLFSALLFAHVILSQNHTVNISWPVKFQSKFYSYYNYPQGWLHLTHSKSLSHSQLILMLVTRCSVRQSAPSEVQLEFLHRCDDNGCRASPAGRSEEKKQSLGINGK